MSAIKYTREEAQNHPKGEMPDHGLFCECCNSFIPKFEDLSEEDERVILEMWDNRGSLKAYTHLMALTGCSLLWAREWLFHRGKPNPNAHKNCPYCEEKLRTPLAQQCRHCKKQWHGGVVKNL
jgi:hypothetical protein